MWRIPSPLLVALLLLEVSIGVSFAEETDSNGACKPPPVTCCKLSSPSDKEVIKRLCTFLIACAHPKECLKACEEACPDKPKVPNPEKCEHQIEEPGSDNCLGGGPKPIEPNPGNCPGDSPQPAEYCPLDRPQPEENCPLDRPQPEGFDPIYSSGNGPQSDESCCPDGPQPEEPDPDNCPVAGSQPEEPDPGSCPDGGPPLPEGFSPLNSAGGSSFPSVPGYEQCPYNPKTYPVQPGIGNCVEDGNDSEEDLENPYTYAAPCCSPCPRPCYRPLYRKDCRKTDTPDMQAIPHNKDLNNCRRPCLPCPNDRGQERPGYPGSQPTTPDGPDNFYRSNNANIYESRGPECIENDDSIVCESPKNNENCKLDYSISQKCEDNSFSPPSNIENQDLDEPSKPSLSCRWCNPGETEPLYKYYLLYW